MPQSEPARPNLLVLLPPTLYRQLFTSITDSRLREIANVTFNPHEANWSVDELTRAIGDYEMVITGWGSPIFTDRVLQAANRLRLIAHTAGSIKKLLPPPVFARKIAITHAAAAIAPAVAEMTVLLILMGLRHPHLLDRKLRSGGNWRDAQFLGQELAGQRVGVVGAGHTGRNVIRLLRAWDAHVWVYDPYLSVGQASELGVTKVALNELFSGCPIVTMQAPPTAETYHLVGSTQLRALPDGAIFVNTARSQLVDEASLLAELQTGRIFGALDVFEQEPLPLDSPFLKLENVIVTPHVAGASVQARLRQGTIIVEEIARFIAGESLRYPVTAKMLPTMA